MRLARLCGELMRASLWNRARCHVHGLASPSHQGAPPPRRHVSHTCLISAQPGHDVAPRRMPPYGPNRDWRMMMARKGYWVALIRVTNIDLYTAYVRAVGLPFGKYQARYLTRGGASETVEGNAPA